MMLTNPDPHLQWQILRASRVKGGKLKRISPRPSSPHSGCIVFIHLLFLRLLCYSIYNPRIDFV